MLNCAGGFRNGEPGFSFALYFLGGGDKGFSALNPRPHGLHVLQQCGQTAGAQIWCLKIWTFEGYRP